MGEHGILLVCGVLSSLLRGAQFTLTDTMHIGLAMVTVLLMALAIGLGAAAFGKRLRVYSIEMVGAP